VFGLTPNRSASSDCVKPSARRRIRNSTRPRVVVGGNTASRTPTTLSFRIEWGGSITDRRNVTDTTNGFAGEFVFNSATMVWTANEPNRPAVWGGPAMYVSDPASTSHSDFAMVGHERNGVFFRH